MRTIALAGSIVVMGAMPGAGVAGTATGPAGFSIDCTPTVMGGAPDRTGAILTGTGKGSCVMTGSFGAPWRVRASVRLQAKVSGTWRTRASATVQTADTMAATKRIPFVQAGLACGSTTTRKWRVRVIVEAVANEKVEFVIQSRSAVSPVTTLAC